MALVTLHRTAERKHLGVPARVERLEEDADVNDAAVSRIEKKVDSLRATAMGMLVSLVIASIMLALNMTVK